MRPPAFWRQYPPGLAARLLSPLAEIYGGVAARRMDRPGVRLSAPVVCVGNFVVGGAGKTPLALALAEMLKSAGETPFFLTRGYGGTLGAAPVRVDDAGHIARQVGDEPLLLARSAPTIVARRRPAGAAMAIAQGASVIVMDDGLQNPSLEKTFAIAAVDGAAGVGNGLCLPAGPLRAPMARQWPRVDALALIGEGEAGERVAMIARPMGLPVFAADLAPDPAAAAHLRGRRVLAFAGIGRPEKFFATLEELGALVVARRAFADHHRFSAQDIASLRRQAWREQALLVTTQKDFVRIPPAERPEGLAALPVRLALRKPEGLLDLARAKIAEFKSRS